MTVIGSVSLTEFNPLIEAQQSADFKHPHLFCQPQDLYLYVGDSDRITAF